jgi:hypothetical protein
MTSNFDGNFGQVGAANLSKSAPRNTAQEEALAESQGGTPACDSETVSESMPAVKENAVEKHKFVGRSREREDILKSRSSRIEPPADVRRWSQALGLYAHDFTAEDVHKAWRAQISSPSVHPDLGGELEQAILLNTAKDSLVKWLESFAPKLGKQFSSQK